MREKIFALVCDMAEKKCPDAEVLTKSYEKEWDLVDDFGFDSLLLINLVIELENKLDIEFPDDTLVISKLRSFYNLCSVVEERLGEGENE